MNTLEKQALKHAEEYLRYARSKQSVTDMQIDAAKRRQADRAAGHLPACSLTKCCRDCPKATGG
jgi:hypothetical protein